jgi:hypothetical protein
VSIPIPYYSRFSTQAGLADLETFMDTNAIRSVSKEIVKNAGLALPDHLPLLETSLELRSQNDAINRLLCLTAIGAASYGFDKGKALGWLRQEKLEGSLAKDEIAFLRDGVGSPQAFQVQIEGMWALAWALTFVPTFDFWHDCDSRFVTLLPNLKINQCSDEWRRKALYRETEEIAGECDLAYCLHWAVRQAEIAGKPTPGRLKSYVVIERRRALEWLLGNDAWDAISLDT